MNETGKVTVSSFSIVKRFYIQSKSLFPKDHDSLVDLRIVIMTDLLSLVKICYLLISFLLEKSSRFF